MGQLTINTQLQYIVTCMYVEMTNTIRPLCLHSHVVSVLLSCLQRSGGRRAPGTGPGAATEEVCQTAKGEVSDAVTLSTSSYKMWNNIVKSA